MQRVYRATASLAQPDFTAECLAARNAGTEVFLLVVDTNSLRRIAAACARQQFRPLFAYVGPMVTDNLKDDPNLANSIAQSNVFPYFQNNTPATREFSDAVRRFGAKLQPGPGTAQGWVTGKLFERAAQALPEPPTSAAVLDGLWSLRDESLGGLTAPMTFTRNKPAPPVTCWFNLMLDKDGWRSGDNATLHCR